MNKMKTRNRLRTGFRVFLWLGFGFFFLKGLTQSVSGNTSTAPVTDSADRIVFPDQQGAEAFAVNFTTKYLTFKPGGQEKYDEAIAPYHSLPEEGAGFIVPQKGAEQRATQVLPSRFTALDRSRARVVVSANVVTSTKKRTSETVQYWTVNIARDAEGGLSVYQYPSRVAGPATAMLELENLDRPDADEAEEFEQLLTYFFPAYFSGDEGMYAAYITNRTVLEPVPAGQFEFISVEEILQPEGSQGPRRDITVEIQVSNPGGDESNPTGVRAMSYDMELRRASDNRWLVSAINPE